MMPKLRTLQLLALLSLLASLVSSAHAVSGRALAIGRAFNYAYNNPLPEPGEGPMGSSVYTGGNPYNVPVYRGPAPAGAVVGDSPLTGMRVNQVYTPMAPVMVVPSGGSTALAPIDGTPSNPVRELSSALALKYGQGPSFGAAPLTSLAPQTPGGYKDAMLRGEAAFRDKQYAQAAASFESARALSKESAESLLSLAQAYFAMGPTSYPKAAENLAKALKAFPDLPLVRVRPVDFFASPADYNKALAQLQDFAKQNPNNADALFLLGYMQWRSRVVDQAVATLDAASSAAPAADLANGIAALLDAISKSSETLLDQAPPMNAPQDYAWAGIRISTPAGFKPTPLAAYSQVLVGTVADRAGRDPHQVSLYAYPLAQGVSIDAFLTSMTDYMRRSPATKDMTDDGQAEVPFQTGKALVRTFTYTSGDHKSVMAWLAFIRESKDKGPRIGYMLGLAVSEAQAIKLLPTLAAMAKSIALTDFAAPSINFAGPTIDDGQLGFSILQPQSFAGRQTDKGYEMGQMNFASSQVTPRVEVIVVKVGPDDTAKSFGEQAAQRPAKQGVVRKLLSSGPTKLAGADGYQFVASHAPAEGWTGYNATLVAKLICVDRPDGKWLYALVVECRNAEPEDAQAQADQFANAFKLLHP